MATYAAVVSLMNTMDAVMNDPRLSTCFHKQQIQFLAQKLDVLLQFIENCDYNSLRRDQEAQSLERRITSAAHMAEDVIESHIVTQIHAGVLEDASSSSIDLHQIMHDIDEIKEEVVKVAEKTGSNDQTPKNSPQPLPTGKITMIGFDDYLSQLLDGLTGFESGRQVISIVGMGGVGKTTLTKNAYENLLTVRHFDVRAWVSISQQFDVKNILVQLLSTLGQSTHGNNEGELVWRLYKYLYGRRYLVVLDDMWSITAWDKLQFCFPRDSSSSRVIVTTRLLEVANDLSSSRVVRVGLLDDNKSWDLFCDKVFAQQGGACPNELDRIGKTIVKKCKGLPLSIVVIGALLRRSPQTKEYWENIAENMSSILSLAEDGCLDILCLSYNHLPAHLKPCFLYLGIFSEDHKISVSRLIKLWIAEGFIKPNKDQMLEDVAEGYVNDLLERSLILVDTLGWNKKFERFHIHDLVRDMCLREAQKEKFYFVISRKSSEQEVKVERGIVHHQRWWIEMHDSYSLTSTIARSLICERFPPRLYGSTLLRVCVVNDSSFDIDKFFNYFQNVNMRLISCITHENSFEIELPRSIFLLWNLQALIVKDYGLTSEAPIEIWKMRQLRHIEFGRINLPEPPLSDDEEEFVVLHNLQTLTQVQDLRCSEEVCKRIPNIKRLEVYYKYFSKNSNDYYCLQNFGRLYKLEFLSYNFGGDLDRDHLVQNLTLPTSLKELSLLNSNLDWDDLRIIGSLPNLEVLNLVYHNVSKEWEWNCVEGEFLALKHLEIQCSNLIIWNVESSHFPVLDTLFLVNLASLEEIPSGIGDIPTLRIVHLRNCNTTFVISTLKMLEEQESQGNDEILVELEFFEKHQLKKILEEVEKEAITCTNFNYKIYSPSSFCN